MKYSKMSAIFKWLDDNEQTKIKWSVSSYCTGIIKKSISCN